MLPVKRALVVALACCSLMVAGCSTSHGGAAPKRHTPSPPSSTSSPSSSTSVPTSAPTALPATYEDTPRGQPGYALVVNPGPAGSGIVGGVAVYQFQNGTQSAYFSFYGRAVSAAPFPVDIKGDRATDSATFQVTPASNSSITIENCAQLFSPAIDEPVPAGAEPPLPASCTFTYNLAPGPPRTTPTVTTNMAATPAIKAGLLSAYLLENGWQQTPYASEISLQPGSTYVAYDPETGLDWAYATFEYSGNGADASSGTNPPDVAMQDGGDEGFFYQIPLPGVAPTPDDYWVMVGILGLPSCFSQTSIPSSVLQIWGLSDSPGCTTQG
jgi:hypothetical protein